jgi:hypothetical protein
VFERNAEEIRAQDMAVRRRFAELHARRRLLACAALQDMKSVGPPGQKVARDVLLRKCLREQLLGLLVKQVGSVMAAEAKCHSILLEQQQAAEREQAQVILAEIIGAVPVANDALGRDKVASVQIACGRADEEFYRGVLLELMDEDASRPMDLQDPRERFLRLLGAEQTGWRPTIASERLTPFYEGHRRLGRRRFEGLSFFRRAADPILPSEQERLRRPVRRVEEITAAFLREVERVRASVFQHAAEVGPRASSLLEDRCPTLALPPMTPREEAVLRIIAEREHYQPITSEKISSRLARLSLSMEASCIRSRIIPRLKKLGLRTHGKAGYSFPADILDRVRVALDPDADVTRIAGGS